MSIKSDPRVDKILSEIGNCKKRIAGWQKLLISKEELQGSLRTLRQKISQTESDFKNKGMVAMLKFNTDYKANQSEAKRLDYEIQNHQSTDGQLRSRIRQDLKNIDSCEKNLTEVQALIEDEKTHSKGRSTDVRSEQEVVRKQAETDNKKEAITKEETVTVAQETNKLRSRRPRILVKRDDLIKKTLALNNLPSKAPFVPKVEVLKGRLLTNEKKGQAMKEQPKEQALKPSLATPLIGNKKNDLDYVLLTPSWEDVYFADGYVLVRYNNRSYKKYVSEAKKFFNDIKSHYTFMNVPRLQVVIRGPVISEIKNEEVLFFHIELFSASGSVFDHSYVSDKKIYNWSKYTKGYYRKHLPFALHSHCLTKLCKVCDPTLPIIPVSEVVINSKGSKSIHNSFLFPVRTKSGVKVVWESVEDSKASYVFEIKGDYWACAQKIYDYISGETVNKRSTLVANSDLKSQLNMKPRVMHTDLFTWELGIKSL